MRVTVRWHGWVACLLEESRVCFLSLLQTHTKEKGDADQLAEGQNCLRRSHWNNRRYISVDDQLPPWLPLILCNSRKSSLFIFTLTKCLSSVGEQLLSLLRTWRCGWGCKRRLQGCQKSQARVARDQRVWDSSGSTLFYRSHRPYTESGLKPGKGLSRREMKICRSLLYKLFLHFRDLWSHYKGWKGGNYWEDSLFLLMLSQFFIWDAATS